MIGDAGTKYAGPVTGMNIDRNLIDIKVASENIGENASIIAEDGVKIINRVITNNESSSIKLFWNEGILEASGNINKADISQSFKLSPMLIEPYVIAKLKKILKELNIKGKIKVATDKSNIPHDLIEPEFDIKKGYSPYLARDWGREALEF